MISKSNQYESSTPTEAEVDDILDSLADVIFDMWNTDIKENETKNI